MNKFLWKHRMDIHGFILGCGVTIIWVFSLDVVKYILAGYVAAILMDTIFRISGGRWARKINRREHEQ